MADSPSSLRSSETIAANEASFAGGEMPASIHASATFCMFGRVPVLRMEATTDLMELRNLLISLGSFQKCEPFQSGWLSSSKKLGQYHLFGSHPGFLRKGKKIFICHLIATPAARRECFHFYRLFANIFRKPNMSHNQRSHDETTQHPSRPDRQRKGHLLTNQTHADDRCFGCFSL